MEKTLLFLVKHFPDLLDLNLTATIVILFVMSVRVLMKQAPKAFSCVLWTIVLLRLLVPVSIESPVSFVPERTEFSSMVDLNQALPELEFQSPSDRESNRLEMETAESGAVMALSSTVVQPQTYLTFLWLAGAAAMLLWGLGSWLRLRAKLREVIPAGEGVFLGDDIGAPFVMGFLKPRIYLPSGLTEVERGYILLHERSHIRRGDHIVKWLFWLALCIHWFNPFVWAAFVLAGRDMEMCCDETVIRTLPPDIRGEYAASLLRLATGRKIPIGTPVSFGEGDPKGRIRNIAAWKKPALWLMVLCVVICVVLMACLLTNPKIPEPPLQVNFLDLDRETVTEVTLQNGHNGQFTHLADAEAAKEICDIVKSVYGTNGISSKGYYGCSYSVKLYSGKEEILSLAFGDSDVFFHGIGEDGYPVLYELDGLSLEGVIRLLSRYDESGYDWNAANTAKRWGVELTADDAAATGVRLTVGLDTSVLSTDYLIHNSLFFGEFYEIEQKQGRDWVMLERHDPEPSGPADVERLTPITESSGEQVYIDWTKVYGALLPGEYRITLHISRISDDGAPEILPVSGKFVIS